MEKNKRQAGLRPRTGGLLFCLLLFVALLVATGPKRAATQGRGGDQYNYLPLLVSSQSAINCPTSSSQSYSQGTAFQFDLDNPVRPAWNHADKNLELRSYTPNNSPTLVRELVSYGSNDPIQPPQFATMFNPAKVPALIGFYRVYSWHWEPSPDPGTRGEPNNTWPTTVLGLVTTPGEVIHVPTSGYDIGGGMEVLVLFADEDSVMLKYTREDSVGSGGYAVHIDNICTDPQLLALYNALDNPNGPRYVYVPPQNRPYAYDLPQLPAGKPVGVARGNEVVIAIVDSGSFMDPRSCHEWWQIRPGYGGSCPPALQGKSGGFSFAD